MLATLLLAAEEAAEPSKTPFYIVAGALVAFALLLAAVGIAAARDVPALARRRQRAHRWSARCSSRAPWLHGRHHGVTRISIAAPPQWG